jgi:hypothetical protein
VPKLPMPTMNLSNKIRYIEFLILNDARKNALL